jgi:hypothetical protein
MLLSTKDGESLMGKWWPSNGEQLASRKYTWCKLCCCSHPCVAVLLQVAHLMYCMHDWTASHVYGTKTRIYQSIAVQSSQ